MASDSCNKNDLAQRKIALLLWGLPVVLLAVGVFWFEVRVWLWPPALVVAGVACLANCDHRSELRADALVVAQTSGNV